MDDLKEQRDYWDDVAWDKEFTIPLQLDLLLRAVPRDAAVLDLGCGYGRSLAELAEAGYENLFGADISANLLRRCRSQAGAFPVVVNEPARLPFDDGSFAAVLLVGVLTSIPADEDQRLLVQEAHRVLGPGGVLYCADFLLNEDDRSALRYLLGQRDGLGPWGVFTVDDRGVMRHHSREWIEELTRGFEPLFMEAETFATMHGHQSNGFSFVGKKPAAH